MNQLKVMLWGEELGRIVWDQKFRTSYFTFNPDIKDRPDITPILAPLLEFNNGLPIYGDDRRIYQKLPPFIADSLPDSWGNKLFEKWVKQQNLPSNRITPLYKLMFIGKRGMGAFEYLPAADELNYKGEIDIKKLYDLSLEMLKEREETFVPNIDKITMETLIAVGTSAGGRQMKAIVAINNESGEIRSGQVEIPSGFQHYIVKFEDSYLPTTEIEMAYYQMAIEAGIKMEECDVLEIDGTKHFLTKRFDRKGNEKIYMQTLAAINPAVDSYNELFATCRRLNLSEKEIVELYRRLVFNVIANNTDDHNKNFSFLLEKRGEWRLSPAYDMTFIFNRNGTAGETYRCMSLYGKTEDITRKDLIDFAKDNNIRNPEKIIQEVVEAAKEFPDFAERYEIPEKFYNIINLTINKNLRDLGFTEDKKCNHEYVVDS